MKISGRIVLNLSFIFLLFIFACAFQSVLWYQIVGFVPPPLTWLLVVFYILITRETFAALMLCYFFAFVASRFSSVPLGTLLPVIGLLSAAILSFRSRIFWRGSSYYFLVCSGGIFLFHILYLSISFFLEENFTALLFVDRITQMILTLGFIYPFYRALRWIDRTFQYQEGFGTGELI